MGYLDDLKRNSYIAGYDAGIKFGLAIALVLVLITIAYQWIYAN